LFFGRGRFLTTIAVKHADKTYERVVVVRRTRTIVNRRGLVFFFGVSKMTIAVGFPRLDEIRLKAENTRGACGTGTIASSLLYRPLTGPCVLRVVKRISLFRKTNAFSSDTRTACLPNAQLQSPGVLRSLKWIIDRWTAFFHFVVERRGTSKSENRRRCCTRRPTRLPATTTGPLRAALFAGNQFRSGDGFPFFFVIRTRAYCAQYLFAS